MRSTSKVDKWIPSTVVKVCGTRVFGVKTGHKTRYVRSDHIIRAHNNIKPNEVNEQDIKVSELQGDNVTVSNNVDPPSAVPPEQVINPTANTSPEIIRAPPFVPIARRSRRVRKPVV